MTLKSGRLGLCLLAWIAIPMLLVQIITSITGAHGGEFFIAGTVLLGVSGAVLSMIHALISKTPDLSTLRGGLLGIAAGIITYPITWILLGGFSDWWPLEWPLVIELLIWGFVLGAALAFVFFGRSKRSAASHLQR